MLKSSKKQAILIGLTLVLGLGLFGCGKVQPAVNANQNQNTNLNTNIATTTGEIDTSDWKTYRNEEYGFEFKYPKDWEIKNLSDGRISLNPLNKTGYEYVGDIILNLYNNPNKESAKNFYTKNNFNLFQNYEPIEKNIGSHKLFYFEETPGMILSDIYVYAANNLIFEFTVFDNKIISEELIKSIKFN